MNRDEHVEAAVVTGDMRRLNNLAKQALLEGVALEHEAERCRMEAERAFQDVGAMKVEGRDRSAVQNPRMLPSAQRAVDVRTNSFKAVADAKGDVMFYSSQATMYAGLAAMKFAKAAALKRWG